MVKTIGRPSTVVRKRPRTRPCRPLQPIPMIRRSTRRNRSIPRSHLLATMLNVPRTDRDRYRSAPEPRWVGREHKIGKDSEVVTGPHTVHRTVQDALAVRRLQRRPMQEASYEDVVDLAGHRRGDLALAHQRVRQLERVPGSAGWAYSHTS
jgi:hypothetical protein